jgi:hypothetical protein
MPVVALRANHLIFVGDARMRKAAARFSVIATALATFAVPAAADSSFERVGQLFDAGTMVNLEDNVGYHIGRCFKDSNPDTPHGGAISIANGSLVGPLGDAQYRVKYAAMGGYEPAYFDDMTENELAEILDYYSWYDLVEVGAENYVGAQLSNSYYLQLRINGDYLVGTNLSNGHAYYKCYYFKVDSSVF